RVEIVPTLGGIHSIPQSLYFTNPPVQQISGICHVAVLRSVNGYRIQPGAWVRLFVVYRLIAPGRYHSPTVSVNYRSQGHTRIQVLPYAFSGTVTANGPSPKLDLAERACLSKTAVLPANHGA
ncbi:MAG TPA: hypothetical protein VFJ24_07260, partial [Gaiellales bacterium]|nr:hypothetical protein [Gaiellales bacterium]